MHIRTPNETIVRIKRKKEKKTRWENSHCIREHEAGWRVVTPVSDTSSRRLFWGVAPLSDWRVSHLAILDSILPNGSSITQTPHTQTSGGKNIYIYEEVGGGWSRRKLGRKKSCSCCSCKLADVTSFARLTPQGRGRQNREGWQSVRGGAGCSPYIKESLFPPSPPPPRPPPSVNQCQPQSGPCVLRQLCQK